MTIDPSRLLDIFLRDKISLQARAFYKQDSDEIIKTCREIVEKLVARFNQLSIFPADSFFVLEYGGIGDSFHTKVWMQHVLRRFNLNPVLITNKHNCSLYRDDMDTFDHQIVNPYRNPAFEFITYGLSEVINLLFVNQLKTGKGACVDISRAISRIHYKMSGTEYITSLADPYYIGTGVERDFDLKPKLIHNGDIGPFKLPKKFVCLETSSISFSEQQPEEDFYNRLVQSIDDPVVLLGGPDDLKPEGCLDYRGIDLYDAYTLVKNCSLMIGRNSANQGLTIFSPDVPVIDINSSDDKCLRFDSTGYRSNVEYFNSNNDLLDDILASVSNHGICVNA